MQGDTVTMVDAIIRGIEQANFDHVRWTRNCWVSDYGAEGLVQVRVAEQIDRMLPHLGVMLEPRLLDLQDDFDIQHFAEFGLGPRSRPDIATFRWNEDKKHIISPHIVEIKRKWNRDSDKEILRCGAMASAIFGGKESDLAAIYLGIFLNAENRNAAKRLFFKACDHENVSSLRHRAQRILENNGIADLLVEARLGAIQPYRWHPDWPLDKTFNVHRWRAAVVQFTLGR